MKQRRGPSLFARRSKRRFAMFAPFALWLAGAAIAAPSPSVGSGPHVRVSLLADHARVAPGQTFRVGLHFELERGWHVYWRNPGDSGEPPSVAWRLPDTVKAGPLAWPRPVRLRVGPLVNFGYEGSVLLAAPLELTDRVRAGQKLPIGAEVSWLVCRESCVPGRARLSLDIPVASAPDVDPRAWARFETMSPGPVPRIHLRYDADDETLRLALPAALELGATATFEFFPATAGIIAASAQPSRTRRGAGWQLAFRLEENAPAPLPEALEGLLVVRDAAGPQQRGASERARWVVARRGTEAQARQSAAGVTRQPAAQGRLSLGLVLLLAFVGGLLLNLMPCVFPVLSLKVVALSSHREDSVALRRHGVYYALGVVLSFVSLAALLLVLRGAGEELGWGFQLQSPRFVVLLALLFFALGLNMAGVFEIGLALTRMAGSSAAGHGTNLGALSAGVLAVVAATPCTAPFMGSALGYALAQPAAAALAVFAMLGLGMAAPYLVLSTNPRLLARLPRPGRWMETFKQLMAFPLFGAAIWLAAVLSRLRGDAALIELLVALLLMGFALWLFGRSQRSVVARRRAVGLAATCVAALLALAVALDAAAPAAWAPGRREHGTAAASATDPAEGLWQPWSAERVARLRAAKRPVFVNFTADWCISCKVNERLVLRSDAVQRAFARHEVVALKADWTHEDPAITRALAAHGRAGVPLYLYYAPSADNPQVLPAVLTPDIVLDALAGS